MKKINICHASFSLGYLMIFFGCAVKTDIDKQDPMLLEVRDAHTEVSTITAERRSFEYLINTTGKIESLKEMQLQANLAGLISEVLVKNGQFVNKNDLIARIENNKQKLELDKAEVMLNEKRISFQDQFLGFNEKDEEKNKIIKENIRYTSGVAAAEISFELAKREFENTFLRSAISGIVSDLNVKEGSRVNTGEALCTIHDPNSLVVSCEILEADVHTTSIGQRAEIQPIFEKDLFIQGKILTINPRVNQHTGFIKLQIAIEKSKKLLPGMNVSVKIKVPYKKELIVPKEAVVIRSGKPVIFTEENGLAKWNFVTTGRENGIEIEVIDGLKENQKVIITNNLQLAHDAPVKVLGKL